MLAHAQFSQQLVSLTYLNVGGCPGLTLNGVRGGFPCLRVLVLSGCECLPAIGVQPALESCSSLEEVYMDSCPLLAHITLGLPRLRVLSMRGCRALVSLEVWRCSACGLCMICLRFRA